MTFSQKTQNVCLPYSTRGDLLSSVNGIKNLDVEGDSSLRFDDHVNKIVGASLQALGFIKHVT